MAAFLPGHSNTAAAAGLAWAAQGVKDSSYSLTEGWSSSLSRRGTAVKPSHAKGNTGMLSCARRVHVSSK